MVFYMIIIIIYTALSLTVGNPDPDLSIPHYQQDVDHFWEFLFSKVKYDNPVYYLNMNRLMMCLRNRSCLVFFFFFFYPILILYLLFYCMNSLRLGTKVPKQSDVKKLREISSIMQGQL